MTAEMNTIYSISLFFSLASLMLWSARRQRVSQNARATFAPNERVEG